jgi:hypothetical protein
MGVAPSELKRLTVWEFSAVADRWIEAHEASDKPGSRLSENEKDELWDWMKTRTDIPVSRAAARAKKNGNGADGPRDR